MQRASHTTRTQPVDAQGSVQLPIYVQRKTIKNKGRAVGCHASYACRIQAQGSVSKVVGAVSGEGLRFLRWQLAKGSVSCCRRAQRSELLRDLLKEAVSEEEVVPADEEEAPVSVDATSTALRSARICLRSIKTCTRSSSVSWRARVRNRLLRRSAFLRSLASCFFWLRSSVCCFFNEWIDAESPSCGKALLSVSVA